MKKIISLFMISLLAASIFAADYYALSETGTVKEIRKEFKTNSALATQVFGDSKETFLMLVLKNSRDYKIVSECINGGCSPDAQTTENKTPLMYASEFSQDERIIDLIVKTDTITKKARAKRILNEDSNSNNSFDYARKNKNPKIWEALNKYADDPKGMSVETTIPFQEPSIDPAPATPVTGDPSQEIVQEEPVAVMDEEPAANSENQEIPPAETTPVIVAAPVMTPEENSEITKIEESSPETLTPEKPQEEQVVQKEPALEETEAQVQEELVNDDEPKVELLADISDETKKAEIKQYTKAFLLDFEETPEEDKVKESRKQQISNPNQSDKNGVTLLMQAAKTGNDWDLQLLLENGADVNLRDKDGWTALMYACRYQNSLGIVNALIEKGAYIRTRNKYNATPLLMAADYSQNPEIIKVLMNGRSSSDDEVFKAFILAITGNSVSEHVRLAKISIFIESGVQLNRFWNGMTPLMYAAQYCSSTKVIKLLMDSGAKVSLSDSQGKTAYDYAKNNKTLPKDDVFWSLNGKD